MDRVILRKLSSFLLIEKLHFGKIPLMSESTQQTSPPSLLHVVLEPRAGHTLQEILLALEQAGATEIDQISPEFVSAEIAPSSVPSLEAIAFVETKKSHGLA